MLSAAAAVPTAPPQKSHKSRNIVMVMTVVSLLAFMVWASVPGSGSASNAVRVASFWADGGYPGKDFLVYFTLVDSNWTSVASDGTVRFAIADKQNNTIYSTSFKVHSSDFVEYEFPGWVGPAEWTYYWAVPLSQVGTVSPSYQEGHIADAYLTFVTPSGASLSYVWNDVDLGWLELG